MSENLELSEPKLQNDIPGTYKEPGNLPSPLICEPISKKWQNSLVDRWWSTIYDVSRDNRQQKNTFSKPRKLISRLLSFGGSEACVPLSDEHTEALLDDGLLLLGDNPVLTFGIANNCHENSSIIWRGGQKELVLMTGYALGDDGMWRQHSWCVFKETGQVIETTCESIAYFGVVLNDEDSEEFYHNNYIM